MKETNKWSVKDVITTVLLSAVLIVIQLVINMVCMANDFVSMVLSVGITMFLCAPVYMLMVSRIGKRFVTLTKTETADCRLDGGEPAVQRGQSAAHLVFLGHLL